MWGLISYDAERDPIRPVRTACLVVSCCPPPDQKEGTLYYRRAGNRLPRAGPPHVIRRASPPRPSFFGGASA